MRSVASTYSSEMDLVKSICDILISDRSPWGSLNISLEFSFQRGRADIVAVDSSSHLIAYEAKLSRWRDALLQAYRNTCFAHYSYVILPYHVATRVSMASDDFRRHSVGLVAASPSELDVLIPSPFHDPIQPWLSESAIDLIGVPA
jgi:hypothetical protein